MARSKPKATESEKKRVTVSREKLATAGLKAQTETWVKIVVKKRLFIFSA
ncbi:hypothetical protein [Archangium sp.]|jgi:hypothetical protein